MTRITMGGHGEGGGGGPRADHARQRQIEIFPEASWPEADRINKAIGTPSWTLTNVETIPDLVELVNGEGLHTIRWNAATLHINRA